MNAQTDLFTLCMLGMFSYFCCRLLTFFKINFFQNTIRVSNNLDPGQDRHSVGPDMCPNCVLRLSADDKSHPYKQELEGPKLLNSAFFLQIEFLKFRTQNCIQNDFDSAYLLVLSLLEIV